MSAMSNRQSKPSKEIFILRWLLLLASILLAIGLVSPMITLTKLFFSQHSFSVMGGIGQLFSDGQILIALIIGLFSVALPIIKIGFLFLSLSEPQQSPAHQRHLQMMHDYGRWAMLDVMVVAIIIVTVKLGAIASIQVHSGLYIFGAAVLLIMLITHQAINLKQQ